MKIRANQTLTAIEMNRQEVVEFELVSGASVRLELVATGARILRTTLPQLRVEVGGGRTDYAFYCVLRINGIVHAMEREVATQRSFYQPWEIDGVRIWLDAVDDIFEFLTENHGPCRPHKHARLALQDATLRICPEPLHPWCPWPEEGLRIEHCYCGEDCWLGAYFGAAAHGGLDLNHPAGTPLWAPLDLDDHFYFNSLAMGHLNNRWRGIRRWPDGSEWILEACHMTELTVAEHVPIRKGEQFARGAGVFSGAVDHSHFVFKVHQRGETILLDPWILFWQMQRDLPDQPQWQAATAPAFEAYRRHVKPRGHSFITRGWQISPLMPQADVARAPYRGLAADVKWRQVPSSGTDFIDVHELAGPDGLVYLANQVDVSEDHEWILHVGHDGGVRVFIDGQPVAANPGLENPAPYRRTQARVAMRRGEHGIVIALDRSGGRGWGVFVSFQDPDDVAGQVRPFPTPVQR